MSNSDTLRGVYASMTPGQKQHMANKLWKEDRVVAQKVKDYIPAEEFHLDSQYNPGDMLVTTASSDMYGEVSVGEIVQFVEFDAEDSEFCYKVCRGDGSHVWMKRSQVKRWGR